MLPQLPDRRSSGADEIFKGITHGRGTYPPQRTRASGPKHLASLAHVAAGRGVAPFAPCTRRRLSAETTRRRHQRIDWLAGPAFGLAASFPFGLPGFIFGRSGPWGRIAAIRPSSAVCPRDEDCRPRGLKPPGKVCKVPERSGARLQSFAPQDGCLLAANQAGYSQAFRDRSTRTTSRRCGTTLAELWREGA